MAMFPWEQVVVVPTTTSFPCKHCGAIQFVTNGAVEVCRCSAAEEERLLDRERIISFQKARAAEAPSFMEVREKRKLRTGSKS